MGKTKATKKDSGKPALALLPPLAVLGAGDALAFGAAKYAPHNWRLGLDWSRMSGAALRHLMAFLAGEDRDPESGHWHLDHAIASLLFLSESQKLGLGRDDRPEDVLKKSEK